MTDTWPDVTQSPVGTPSESGRAAEPAAAERTGEPRVDAALDRLGELAQAPVEEHPGILGDVHGRLTAALADLAEEDDPDGTP